MIFFVQVVFLKKKKTKLGAFKIIFYIYNPEINMYPSSTKKVQLYLQSYLFCFHFIIHSVWLFSKKTLQHKIEKKVAFISLTLVHMMKLWVLSKGSKENKMLESEKTSGFNKTSLVYDTLNLYDMHEILKLFSLPER